MRLAIFATALLTACSTTAPAEQARTTPPPKAAPVAAAPAGTAAPAADVGPDGPTALAVPAYTLSEDPAVIAAGEQVFATKGCGGCHTFGSKLVGPDLAGLTDRRSLPWIGRMILHPDQMIKQDPVAKDLFRAHMTPMPDQGVSDAELPALVSFIDAKSGS